MTALNINLCRKSQPVIHVLFPVLLLSQGRLACSHWERGLALIHFPHFKLIKPKASSYQTNMQFCPSVLDFFLIKHCSSWFHWFVPPPRCIKLKKKKKPSIDTGKGKTIRTWPHLIGCSRRHISPAESVWAAGASELQATGLVPLLVGAGGNDCAAAAFGTGLIWAWAEQQRVAQLPWDSLEELTQSLRHTQRCHKS